MAEQNGNVQETIVSICDDFGVSKVVAEEILNKLVVEKHMNALYKAQVKHLQNQIREFSKHLYTFQTFLQKYRVTLEYDGGEVWKCWQPCGVFFTFRLATCKDFCCHKKLLIYSGDQTESFWPKDLYSWLMCGDKSFEKCQVLHLRNAVKEILSDAAKVAAKVSQVTKVVVSQEDA